jgi:hypothetical protein
VKGKYNMNKKYCSLPFIALCLLLVAAGCCINADDWFQVEYNKTDKLDVPLASGSTLALENDVGSITIEGLDVANCTVDATVKAKAPTEEEAEELAEQTKIALERSGSTLTIKITKPPAKKRRSISIDFNITVPKETALQVGSDVGEIRILDITEEIKARTDVGEISCKEISNKVDLQADVGKIHVVYSKTASVVCDVNIKTDVGSIDLTTPPGCSAVVQADTDVGSITTDLPLTIKGKVGKNLNGTIGAGEGKIYLKTDVGSIRIR